MARKSKTLDVAAYGQEPEFEKGHVLTRMEILDLFNYYNYMFGVDESKIKKNLFSYFKDQRIKKLDKNELFNLKTVSYIARILKSGWFLPEEMVSSAKGKYNAIINKINDNTPFKRSGVSVRARTNAQAILLCHEIEDEHIEDVYSFLKEKNVPNLYANIMIDHFQKIHDEYMSAYKQNDEQCTEAYSFMKKRELKKEMTFIEKCLEDINSFFGNKKKTRKARKKKKVSIQKKLQFVKYQKEDDTLKIVSIDPAKIVDAKEVWLYNTKYKLLTRLVSDTALDIRRTMIENVNEQKSCSKKIGRHTKKWIDKVLKSGKVAKRKIMDEIKSKKSKLQTRMNENTIILAALK